MKRVFVFVIVLLACASLALAAEDWRGNNRLSGVVTDAAGKPVQGAKVMLRTQRGEGGGPDATTDAKGKWAVLGLSSGAWNIDIEAASYIPKKLSLSFSEGQRLPPVKIALDPIPVQQEAPPAEAVAAPVQEVKIGGVSVAVEVADAVEAGNKALAEKNFKEAVTQYEKAYPSLSANLALKQALARAYYGNGDLKKSAVLLEEIRTAVPTDTQNSLLLAEILLEDGQLERGKAVIESLPPDAVKDPTAVINIGILMLNKKQPAAARDYFTKAIAIDPARAESYYYRGLALVQMNKTKEAKADFQKTVELAPDSSEAKEARELIKQIK